MIVSFNEMYGVYLWAPNYDWFIFIITLESKKNGKSFLLCQQSQSSHSNIYNNQSLKKRRFVVKEGTKITIMAERSVLV